jgi:CHAD domain-containing protein
MDFTFEKYKNSQAGFRKFAVNNFKRTSEKYRKNLFLVKSEFSEDNVHDLRVAIRRFVSVLELLSNFILSPHFKKIRKEIKVQFDLLSELRDIQVMAESVRKLQENFPKMDTFLEYLLKEETKLIQDITKFFKNIKVKKIDIYSIYILFKLRTEKIDPSINFHSVSEFLTLKLNELNNFRKELDSANVKTIHNLRIKTKKFRYLVESLADLIPDSKITLKFLAGQQTKMGLIQDAEVLSKEFQKFMEQNPILILSSEEITEHLQEQKTKLVDDFFLTEHVFESQLNW